MSDYYTMLETEIPPLLDNIVQLAMSPSYWALMNLDINLYDNQVEIVNAVCDLSIPYVGILASRGSGKTYSVAIGIVKLCLDNPGFRIGIFGPKADTSKRLVKEDIIGRILQPTSKVYNQIDWTKTSNSYIQFKNGSNVKALSASPTATQESEHFHVLVLDEAHRISDLVVKEKLVPMLGSFTVAKTIKIGISLYKNNFWHSCNDNGTPYNILRKNWSQCDIYGLQGYISYQGKEYPKRIVDLMPKVVKERLFPLQFADDGRDLWFDSVEGYSEIEWNTQYEMIWMEDINLVLSGDQHKKLASGLFKILKQGRPELSEKYYFGLDTASGTLMPGQKDLDWTVLTILRKNQDNTKDIVAKYMWQGDVVGQMQEIRDIIHPIDGIFKCVMGLADYSNIAIGIVEMFKKEGIPVAGITFGATEPITKKNFKNAMVDQFVFELDSGRVQYPNIEEIKRNKVFKEGYEQWGLLERHRKLGINDKIFVDPSAGHDDHCFVGSTKIRLLDGTTKTIKELADNLPADTYVYSVDLENNNALVPGKVLRAFKTGVKQTLKITLDNGEFFECTPDHKLMLRDGSYKEAKDLVVGQSMMPLYTERKRLFKNYDYEFVYDPSQEKYVPTHRLIAKFIPDGTGRIIHHVNFNRFDNRPTNLIHITPQEHWKIHGENIQETNKRVWASLSKEERLEVMRPLIEKAADLKRGKPSPRRGQRNWDIRICACGCGETFECYPSSKKQFVNKSHARSFLNRINNHNKNGHGKGKLALHNMFLKDLDLQYLQLLIDTKGLRGTARELHCSYGVLRNYIKSVGLRFGKKSIIVNHKIVSIEVSDIQDVYDLTVDKYHNFALDCGIFAHNCSADILAVWCADQAASFSGKVPRSMADMPLPISGPSNLSGMGTTLPGQSGNPNDGKYLKDRLT